MRNDSFAGLKVLVMGLGLHGGGVESARYLASRGAEVTVTDLRDEKVLAPSIQQLVNFPIRYVLGKHEVEDFKDSDLVVKNPGVRPDSPFLKAAKRVETDISLFLAACPARILAVTGSKGKSSTAAALHWALNESHTRAEETESPKRKTYLGGNITISPLSFLDELNECDDVVLELSSWQLGDIRGRDLLKPRAALLTPIMKDHLDMYGSMEAYVNDKRLIYQNQDEIDVTIAADDEWGRSFLQESRGRSVVYSDKPLGEGMYGGWIKGHVGNSGNYNIRGPGLARLWEIPNCKEKAGSIVEIVPEQPLIPGFHQKQNLLIAALALLDLGLTADTIRESLGRFPGIEHRLEFFHESAGLKFYNDSAATIPEAAAAAIRAFEKPHDSKTNLVLVTGGTDKNLDFTPLARAAVNAKAIILLAGTGSEKLKNLLDGEGVKYAGPFDSIEVAISAALKAAAPGDTVVLSPGCASFGMFLNEFDRGRKWKEGVKKLLP